MLHVKHGLYSKNEYFSVNATTAVETILMTR